MIPVDAVSPELALVDPELAARLRALLPDPGCFSPVARPRVGPLQVLSSPPADVSHALGVGPRVATRRARRRALLALSAIGAVSAAVGGLSAFGSDPKAVASVDAARQRAQADARAASTYRWPEVQGAVGYRAELRRDGTIVFSSFARRPLTQLPVGLRFDPGRYTWTVRPELSDSVGRPVVEETFVVSDPT